MTRIDKYVFTEISKGSLLIFFIFLTIAWLLQFTRLISLTNLIQVDILSILYLSLFLIPNLITIIMPFVIIFGLIITFLKLDKDRELISIYSLGLNIKSITKPLIYFSSIILFLLICLNFYFSPKIYNEYKLKEHEIRNKINFDKIILSNFLEINKNTFLDFKKENNKFKEIFIKFKKNNDNIIFAKEGEIIQNKNIFNFKLINGFKITLLETGKIEKLEFENYSLEILNNSYQEYDNFDNNTFSIFDDIKNQNFINIFYKIIDSILVIIIIIFFYFNNIKKYKLNIKNLLIFIFFSTLFLLLNQLLKNSEFNLNYYFSILILVFMYVVSLKLIRSYYDKN